MTKHYTDEQLFAAIAEGYGRALVEAPSAEAQSLFLADIRVHRSLTAKSPEAEVAILLLRHTVAALQDGRNIVTVVLPDNVGVQ